MQKKSLAFLLNGWIRVGTDDWTLPGILVDLCLWRNGVSGSGAGRYLEKISGITLS